MPSCRGRAFVLVQTGEGHARRRLLELVGGRTRQNLTQEIYLVPEIVKALVFRSKTKRVDNDNNLPKLAAEFSMFISSFPLESATITGF